MKEQERSEVEELAPPRVPLLTLVRASTEFSKTAKYLRANSEKEAKELMEGFVLRALADKGLSYKERVLGTKPLFNYFCSLVNPTRQRHLRPGAVDEFRALRRLDWWRAAAGDDFKFTVDQGQLVLDDGQHRAAAFSEIDAPIEIWLMFTRDRAAFSAMDLGKNRKPADVLKMAGFGNPTGAAISAGIIETLNFPDMYRGSVTDRVSRICNYDMFDKINYLPKGGVGELASLLRASRFDPPDILLSRAWHTAFIRGDTDINGIHEPTLKKALAHWRSVEKMCNGDLRTKTVSYITGLFYLAFYEGRSGHWRGPKGGNYLAQEYPISMEYVKAEKKRNPSMGVSSAIMESLKK